MKELLESSNPLFGRFHTILKVEDFDYYESSAFIPSWPFRQRAACYSVFGGSPAALECIDTSISLDENIRRLLLEPYLSYRFEDIAKEYFSRLARSGELEGIMDIGSYWYDDRKRHMNGEFDVVLEFVNGYDVFEVKFLKGKMDLSLAQEEAEKIRSIESFKARRIGFVSIEGFGLTSSDYILIDGAMLYEGS